MAKNIFATVIASAIILLAACGQEGVSHTDDATSGKIKISVDENYQFLADTQINTFMALNPDAVITPTYGDETSVFADFIKDSARVIMVNRQLTAAELAHFDSIKINPHVTTIAWDAVALIVNKSNPDTNLTLGHLRYILDGKVTKWNQLDKSSKLGDLQVVFDNNGSSNARYLLEKFQLKNFPANCQAAESNPNVIKYVEEHPNAIGVIGVNWISDRDDSTSMSFLNNIKVINVSENQDTSFNHEFFPPLAGYVATKDYPLSREVYLIKREPYNGLGTGFVNFCYYEKGQRIIKLMGLLPANTAIKVKQQSLKVKE